MADLSNLSDMINKCTGGSSGTPEFIWQHIGRHNASGVVQGFSLGNVYSWWTLPGTPGGYGVSPGGVRIPTRSTVGAIGQSNPAGGRKKWLVGMHTTGTITTNQNGVFLADRLADCSGLSGTSVALQTITGLAVTRYTGTEAAGNQMFLEVWSAIGATQRTLTVNYTNENGAPKVATCPIGGASLFRAATSHKLIPLAAGDRGVRSVESAQLSASTGTVGDWGITIARPLV